MKIIVDAMGGDNAPLEIVKGAFDAVKEYNVEVILVGDENRIKKVCEENSLSADDSRVSIVHTETLLTMEDLPLSVVRDKSDSSMGIALKLLASGEGDALVSAGNTGALHAGSSLLVRRIKGVQRSAIAAILPFERPTLLMDAGANTELAPAHLLQLGIMGSIYMKRVFGVEVPKVGLLNNGTEPTKGTKTLVETYNLMSGCSAINFAGNIEGKTIMDGSVDVLITDGFTGNVVLKTIEGLAGFLMRKLKDIYAANPVTKLSALPIKGSIKKLKNSFNASEYGRAPLLDLSKPVIKSHGSSDALEIKNAIRQATAFVEQDVIVEIVRNITDSENQQPKPEEK